MEWVLFCWGFLVTALQMAYLRQDIKCFMKVQTLLNVYFPGEAVTSIFHSDGFGSKIFMKSFFT